MTSALDFRNGLRLLRTSELQKEGEKRNHAVQSRMSWISRSLIGAKSPSSSSNPLSTSHNGTERSDDVKAKILDGLDVDKSRVTVLKVDVTDEPTLSEAASQITKLFPSESLQYVFSTAGILHPERSPADLDAANIKEMLSVNLLGQLLVLKHFSPFLPTKNTPEPNYPDSELRPAVWANISARVGSISDNRLGGWYSYRATKAGVNSVTKTFDIHLSRVAGPRVFCVSLHPGTVKTELSREFWGGVKEGKLFSSEFAAERLVGVVVGLKEDQRGLCWDWEGKEVGW